MPTTSPTSCGQNSASRVRKVTPPAHVEPPHRSSRTAAAGACLAITIEMLIRSVRARVISMCAAAAAICIAALVTSSDRVGAQSGCTTLNPVTCENQNPGNPASEWDISGAGDASIQGFATDISIPAGQSVSFKIKTNASAYTIDIYRMGYYSGMGARKVATIAPSAALPQAQPLCVTQSSTGLIDCGNWSVSASWAVPSTAVSGIYFAKLTRHDTGGASHIVFVVRNDVRHSDLLFQTSDTTWQAYNTYGGNSLYTGAPGTNPARAYKVSYNRPFATRDNSAQDWVFNAEYPMVRWLEANGYDVTYATGIDSDRNGANLLNHKAVVTVGHDEYWSGGQRTNFEAARAAGVHLAFFSGNEIFWKTRWENSIDGSNTPNRTLVCYKETHANGVLDPADPPTWTGTWADPRFSPPADGGRPQNALTGTYFQVNDGNTTSISVPAAMGKLRFWRNTSVANLTGSQTATLPVGTLGYEWDGEVDNGFRPAGLMRLSQTTVNVSGKLLDWGSSFGAGTVTHALTLYRHSSGALVFGAGTVQWSWGLDASHDRAGTAADVRMQQATVNLFADMGAQPLTLQAGLVGTAASPDALAPTSTITSPAAGTSFLGGAPVTISGTAVENGGGTVTVVEVSTDGGATWRQATGTTSWSYSWNAAGSGTVTLKSRAFDDSGNAEPPWAGVSIHVNFPACPCSVMNPAATPAVADDTDAHATSLGMRFRSDASGYVTGVRFYKGTIANAGTHVGHLWTNAGALLGSVTFTSETSTGWQQANFASAIPISANTTYVVSYYAPSGHYSSTPSLFGTAGVDNAPLHALRDGVDGANGAYLWNSDGFPTSTFSSEHYWVDVVFNTVAPTDTTPPAVSSVTPAASALLVDPTVVVTATFSEAMDTATISSSTTGAEGGTSSLGTFELRDPQNNLVPATVTYDAASRTASLRAAAPLALSTTYTALVKGGGADPRVKDLAGNALAANVTWSFTTASATPPAQTGVTIWGSTVPSPADDGDPNSVELGTKFRSDVAGVVTGARFYKAALNTGTHTATLWTATGTQLAAATFTSESASGWQQVAFASPVSIAANTTYLISYHAPNGHYSAPDSYLAASGVDNPPLHALKNGTDGPNGVYIYSTTRTFPTQTYLSEAYFVDVVFTANGGPDTTPPAIATYSPANAATGIPTTTGVSVGFSEAMDQTTITTANIKLLDSTGSVVPSTIAYSSGSLSATLTPASALAYSSTYSGLVTTGVKDFSGNAMASNFTWTFTTSAPPPPPPIQGPGGPILVVTSTANPFTAYYAEILRGEGANLFATQDLSQITAATLSGYDAVILGEMPLTSAQVTMFTNWVTGGGSLIAMRPDKQLAGLLGLTDAAATLSNAYLLMNTASGPGKGLVAQTIQFHGAADRYTLNGATSLATLYSNATTATANPAVTLRTVGAGFAAAFTFDLARSVVYTRQGNPAWSGQERDGQAVIRSADLFFGAKTGYIQPDWIDLTKVAIAQADEQQRFLWNILLSVTSSKKPLPRFWYFPRMLKAAVVMTGDDHANGGTAGRFDDYINFSPANCNVANWECVRGTSYIFPNTPLTNTAAAGYVAQGFEIAVHINTDCTDWTPSTLPTFYSSQLSQFASAYPSLPAPRTNRTHCIAWSDYDTQPQVELANGIRLDTSYYYWPAAWIQDRPGMVTGSGMPQRFARTNGTMIDVYQATSQMTDESGQTFPKNIDALLDGAVGAAGYYGAFTANMHTDFNGNAVETQSNQIVTSALARGVPVITAKQLLDWVDGRNGSAFQNLSWNGNQLNFTISAGQGANGIRPLIPPTFGTTPLTGISLTGVAGSYTLETIKGVQYAVFGGVGSAVASYGADVTPPAIAAITATTTSSSATVTWTTNEMADSIVSYGTSPSNLTQ